MSSIYITEPPTKGKVVNPAAAVLVTTGPSPQILLKTTLGAHKKMMCYFST
uniref:Uncharacterized protein n=1 Tax=Amphimedon queenslandica TaxID=400682 RepID=A0A1X7T491_AMPQE